MQNAMVDLPKGLVIAGASSTTGKTTITLALLRALSRRVSDTFSAKSGPDYIDPQFHEYATGNPSLNLDAWAMPDAVLVSQYRNLSELGAKYVVIEGAMGVLDGAGITGKGSTADLACKLGLPIVLVIDASRQSHTVTLIPSGLSAQLPELKIAGVILNKIASERHLLVTKTAIEKSNFTVLGWYPDSKTFELPSRHLGLKLAREHYKIDTLLNLLADQAEISIDIDQIITAMDYPNISIPDGRTTSFDPIGQYIAVAHDKAFAFSYRHILYDWKERGATLLPFSPLDNEGPDPAVDAVFLPGGYPELYSEAISNAENFRKGMDKCRENGSLIYGECGGYMVLGTFLETSDGKHQMLGYLPHDTSFLKPKRQLGYRQLVARKNAIFNGKFTGHEFHYATENRNQCDLYMFKSMDTYGSKSVKIGSSINNVGGSFAHIICGGNNPV